jgi:hypothetical protein
MFANERTCTHPRTHRQRDGGVTPTHLSHSRARTVLNIFVRTGTGLRLQPHVRAHTDIHTDRQTVGQAEAEAEAEAPSKQRPKSRLLPMPVWVQRPDRRVATARLQSNTNANVCHRRAAVPKPSHCPAMRTIPTTFATQWPRSHTRALRAARQSAVGGGGRLLYGGQCGKGQGVYGRRRPETAIDRGRFRRFLGLQ